MNNQSDPPIILLDDSPEAPPPSRPPAVRENTESSTPTQVTQVKRGRGRPPLSAKRQTVQTTPRKANTKKPESTPQNESDDDVLCLGQHTKRTRKYITASTSSFPTLFATPEAPGPSTSNADSPDVVIIPHEPGSSQDSVPSSQRKRKKPLEKEVEVIDLDDSPAKPSEDTGNHLTTFDPTPTPVENPQTSDVSRQESKNRASQTPSTSSSVQQPQASSETPMSKKRGRKSIQGLGRSAKSSKTTTPKVPAFKKTPAHTTKRISSAYKNPEPAPYDEKLEEAWHGYVQMMNIFSAAGTVAEKSTVRAMEMDIEKLYMQLQKEHKEAVQSEVDNEFSEWLNADLSAVPSVPPAKFSFKPETDDIVEHETVKTNNGVVTMPVVVLESSSEKEQEKFEKQHPRMMNYVQIQTSIKTKDKPRLTHMPCFETGQNDRTVFEELHVYYPEGIHGLSRNIGAISDYSMYRLMRKTLETRQHPVENPDIIYYSLYRLFPSKFSQRELSEKFPSLCRDFADKNFDPYTLEPWKKKPPIKVAANFQNIECYSCLQHICMNHGFDKGIPTVFPEGHYYKVSIPLPDPSDIDYCSAKCWKHSDKKLVTEKLKTTDSELLKRLADVYISKQKVMFMPIEQGSFFVTQYAEEIKAERNFCGFVAKYLDLDFTEGKVATCQQIYQLLLDLAERPSAPKLELLQKSRKHASDFKTRNLAFRRYQENKEKQRIKKAYAEKIEEAEGKGADTEALRAKCAHEIKNMSTSLKATVPLVPCSHEGPCNEDAENCSCLVNGICSYLCDCDVNCVQRFPGCVCAPGQCGTKLCNCNLASWECSPVTCRSCGCDDADNPETGCKNYALSRMGHKRTEAKVSGVAGFGLFIQEPCAKGELIVEYVGELITDEEAERRGCIDDRHKASYIFANPSGGAIDAHRAGNNSRFANNNSFDPNMDAKTMVVAGEHRIGMYANRDLAAGEELTFDYCYTDEHLKMFQDTDGKGRRGNASKKKTA